MAEPVFLRRSLAVTVAGSLQVLDAVRWVTPLGNSVRVYFGQGNDAGAVAGVQGPRLALRRSIVAGPNLIGLGACADGEGPVLLGPELQGAELATSEPETQLFKGLNVAVALRHAEPADTVAAWLAYHSAVHGVQGAVIFDRSAPGDEREAFAAELQRVTMGMAGLQRIVLVDAPLPLGRPDQPGLGDPATAPRGEKGNVAPDPWRAPLGDPVLYDILKWRFLARANAVVALNPCDLLPASGEGLNLFDHCTASDTGYVALAGHAIYPWRVKKAAVAGLGDHICRPVPQVDAGAGWVVAPARGGAEHIWLPDQVYGMTGSDDFSATFDRCMSVVFAASEVQDLVQKSELAEDPALVRRASEVFGAKPVRAPASAAVEKAPETLRAPSDRTVIVTCMKNEGPFILEWLAYHRMIGVDDVLVYTNDCDDGTDTMLDLLQARGLVQRRANPFRDTGAKPQHAALDAAQSEPLVQNAGWIICMDVDEYINIHVGNGHLDDLKAAVPDANLISLTWRLFGNSDLDRFEDRFVTDQFTRCAPHLTRRPHQAWGFKTLYQNLGLFGGLGVHRPKDLNRALADRVNWVNGSGVAMPPSMLKTGWRSGISSYGYDLVTLNHYAVRNVESFLVKRDRGRVNHVARDQGAAYWFRMNNNAEEDRTIQRHGPVLRAEVDALMADPQIAAAHAASVHAHKARIDALLADPDYRALYDQLSSDRMKRLSRMHRNFGMNVFLNGPQVIPDSVLLPGTPRNFFFNVDPPSGEAAS